MNTQFAIQGDDIYVLEVNPRASRTVPFVSKVIGLPLAKIAARCMVGVSLRDQGLGAPVRPGYYAVKEAVFPFAKFPGVDPILGPEMKSTGEVMGVGRSFAEAFAKSQLGAGVRLPARGKAFVSVREIDKRPTLAKVGKRLVELGFEVLATRGTAAFLQQEGIEVAVVNKVTEGRPHIVDMIKNDEISFIVNTVEGKQATADSFTIRREALMHKVSYTTTIAGALATVQALDHLEFENVFRLQDLHAENLRARSDS
jgi:carbamoyl-phosphate synthase large subunit